MQLLLATLSAALWLYSTFPIFLYCAVLLLL
mgnify:CR=1 FL=1